MSRDGLEPPRHTVGHREEAENASVFSGCTEELMWAWADNLVNLDLDFS